MKQRLSVPEESKAPLKEEEIPPSPGLHAHWGISAKTPCFILRKQLFNYHHHFYITGLGKMDLFVMGHIQRSVFCNALTHYSEKTEMQIRQGGVPMEVLRLVRYDIIGQERTTHQGKIPPHPHLPIN